MFSNPTAFFLSSFSLFSLTFFLLSFIPLAVLFPSPVPFFICSFSFFFAFLEEYSPHLISCLSLHFYRSSRRKRQVIIFLFLLPSLTFSYTHSSERKEPLHSLFYEPTLNASTRSPIFLISAQPVNMPPFRSTPFTRTSLTSRRLCPILF